MLRVLLLLLGTDYVRSWWRVFLGLGVVLVAVAVFLLVDTMDGVLLVPLRLFGGVLLAEGLLTLVAGFATSGLRRRIVLARGVLMTSCAVLVVIGGPVADIAISIAFGAAFALDGLVRIASAWVVRFPGSVVAALGGLAELALGVLLVEPTVIPYFETVEVVTGVLILLFGWGLVRLGWTLRTVGDRALLPTVFSRGWPPVDEPRPATWSVDGSAGVLTVHVWTAAGTVEDPASMPLIDRYIAAVDKSGKISTGHAAVELEGGFYASHYPREEIDRSPEDFASVLRATADNDVPGRFQPSYAEEAAGWCASTEKVVFRDFNRSRAIAWWEAYAKDATYNLTNRSCSTTSAYALETALEGVVGRRNPRAMQVLRLAWNAELWVAGLVRERAESMAWTPGLVLDYARSLRASLNPPPLPVMAVLRGAVKTLRRAWHG
jgi:uncharacterized membrane protein HdeD (DUF308 family)